MAQTMLFREDMLEAILAGTKTQTRRVLKPQPERDKDGMWHWRDCHWMGEGLGFPASGISDHASVQEGDLVLARETDEGPIHALLCVDKGL